MCKVYNINGEFDIERLPMDSEDFKFSDWSIKYKKSHILQSICTTKERCSDETQTSCVLCYFTKSLELPHLPEMVFPYNILMLKHNSGAKIEFSALDALKSVSNGNLPISVACSTAWKESRSAEHLEEKFKPFDWTFSNDYKGTLSGCSKVFSTDERIDIEKLKEQEKILFYQDLMLYEDELHDNGISSCTIKIRVMPSSFFILLRHFLRVDNVMVRINDTRYYHELTNNYILREYTNRECGFTDLNLPLTMFGDPNSLSPYMPLKKAVYEKITIDGSTIPMENPDSLYINPSVSDATFKTLKDSDSGSETPVDINAEEKQ